jgi:hypothetical protein
VLKPLSENPVPEATTTKCYSRAPELKVFLDRVRGAILHIAKTQSARLAVNALDRSVPIRATVMGAI